jgi:glycosyltransferase involved in cell wall biosynthesis
VTFTVDVIMPALDEALALPLVLPHLPAGYRAIVVDNGSTDGTSDVARSLDATVVVEPQRGFGAACWAGLTAATAEVVAFMDADASFDARELPTVCDPVVRREADLVLGARNAARGAWPLHARLANRVVASELRRRTDLAITDLGPMRAARRQQLIDLAIEDRRSGWPLEMVVLAQRAGWRIAEVSVSYRPRTGRSKVTGTVRGTMRAVQDMGRILART